MPLDDIRDFLDAHLPRLRTLQQHTAETPPGARGGAAREAVTELGMALEELRVTEEELREQNALLAESQQALEHERRRYRAFFENLPEACVLTDAGGVIHEVNEAVRALLGVRAETLRGKPLVVFVLEEDRRDFRRRLVHGFSEDEARRWRLRLQPRRRLAFEATASVRQLDDPVGGEPLLLWVLRDVDDATRAFGIARDEAEGLAVAFYAHPVAACTLDLDGTVLRWNAAAERLLGWTEAELAGAPSPLPAEEMEAGSEPAAAEVRGRDGEPVRVRVALSPLGEGTERRGTLVTFAPDGQAGAAHGSGRAGRGAAPTADASELLGTAGDADVARRLRAGIAAALHLGRLRPGSRLPSIREVAAFTGVDHRAVSAAYREMAVDGLLALQQRQGAFLADPSDVHEPELAETAEWLAGVLTGAAALRVRTPLLPDLVRRWTASHPLRCACLESVEDERAALVEEMRAQWGMDAYPVAAPEAANGRRGQPAFPEQLRGAGLIVTTPWHAAEARAAGRALRVPVVVLTAGAELMEAVEGRLAQGPLTAVVADPAAAARLAHFRGAERLRVLTVEDAEALAVLDPLEPVLATWAAHRRLAGRRLRLLVPFSAFYSRDADRRLAAILVASNLGSA